MASNSVEDSVYKMTADPLGFCVIINIVNIDDDENLQRNNSIEYVNLIRKTFEQLNFKVKIFTDLKDKKIKLKLNEILNSEECNLHDCFVLYIHSHGKEQGFITANNKIIKFDEIYELFSNAKCEKFVGKPKLLFFDCCRGENYSPHLREADKTMVNMSVHSDLFACYSTLKNLVSIRGWFAESLNECLIKYANEMHFSDILVEVNKSIQKKYHDPTGHRQSIEHKILAPNKKLYFNYANYLKHQEQLKIQVLSSNQNDEEKQLKRDSNILKLVEVDEADGRLRFNSKEILNFKNLLKDFKHKHFAEVMIQNKDIESIEDNDFGQISFDRVFIGYCPHLKKIHWNAFGMQSDQIKQFYARINDSNLLPSLISETNSDYDLIKLINSLVNCEVIWINSFDKELEPIKLHKLKKIVISGCNSSYKIESICSYAFYECDKIEEINLGWNDINFINVNTFLFRNQNDQTLDIVLKANKLNESSFALNSLCNFKRPTKLNLDCNKVKYLNENIFKPFFDANELNEIEIDDRYFDVNNKENQWNQCNEKYHQKIFFNLSISGNNDLESIEDNDFSDKNYKRIYIEFCERLRKIHWNAFGIHSDKILYFRAFIGLLSLRSIKNSQYDLIKLINSLANCKVISIKPFHNELQQIKLKKLKRLEIIGSPFRSIKFIVICDYAFYECDQIEYINLTNNYINYISKNVFCFKSESNAVLKLDLTNNQLDQSSFAIDSLVNFKRPTKLTLYENKIKYLKEEVFRPFLNVNKYNSIEINERYFDLNDQRNQWIKNIHFERIHIK